MNRCKKVPLLVLLFSLSLFMVFFGTLAGDFIWYTLGSFILFGLSVYLFIDFPNSKALISIVIIIFLSIRYIPIMKFNQPLFGDPAFDLKTAEEFENNGHIGIIGQHTTPVFLGASRMLRYSGWPSIHLIALTIHYLTGISLFDVFTYFPPLVALGSLLFVYLIANQIFNNTWIGALASLMFATFSLTIHWQIQMIRQNIAYTLAFMAIYLYIKGQTNKKIEAVTLSLLVFAILPVAHHLTALEVFLILCTSLFITWLLRSGFWRRISASAARKFLRTPVLETVTPHLSTLGFCFFVGSCMFLWWIVYVGPMSLQMAGNRFLNIFWGLLGREVNPYSPTLVQTIETAVGLYDILSFIRVFFYVTATLFGIFILVRARGKIARYKTFLYSSLIVPIPFIVIDIFIHKAAELRHLLFLLIPIFLLTAKTVHRLDKRILVVCLLIILIPAPFKLDKTLRGAPTYIYDRSSQYKPPVGGKTDFRSDDVLQAASFITDHTDSDLIADPYVGVALVFYYAAQKVYYLSLPFSQKVYYTSSPDKYLSDEYILVTHQEYLDTHTLRKFPQDSEIVEYLGELPSFANCIYSNGEVKEWERSCALSTNIFLTLEDNNVTVGEIVTLEGVLVDQFSRPLAYETVMLYIRRYDEAIWHYVESLTTDDHGVFVWQDRPGGKQPGSGNFTFSTHYLGSERFGSTYEESDRLTVNEKQN